jgi:hypothetical protein
LDETHGRHDDQAGNEALTIPCDSFLANKGDPAMFELTAFIDRSHKAKLVGAIKEASRLIADCPDPQRQWLAMRELRKLQERLKYPAI